MIIKFTIVGEPHGKGRPRFTVRHGFSMAYTDEKTRTAESNFLAQALPYKPEKPLENPLKMKIKAFCSIPTTYSKKKRLKCLCAMLRPAKKPDLSNILKIIEDSLNTVFFQDDKQIVSLEMEKYYDEVPRTEIEIEEIIMEANNGKKNTGKVLSV